MWLRGKSVRLWCDGFSDRSFTSQPLLHDKRCGMCYHVCGTVHIKEPLLLIRKIAHVVPAAGFLSRYLNGLTLYNRKYNVLSASLNKRFPSSFLLSTHFITIYGYFNTYYVCCLLMAMSVLQL